MSKLTFAGDFPEADEAAWRALVEKALKGADYETALVSKTYDGMRMEPLYTRAGEPGTDPAGRPGAKPYTRGFRPAAEARPWDIRQLHDTADPAETNAAILADLEGGASAIALQVAGPEQPGLKLDTAQDLADALDGMHLAMAGVWLEPGHAAARAADALEQVWSNAGIGADRALGGFGCDPLGTLARTGGHPLSLEQALEEMAGLAKRTAGHYPNVTAITVDARPCHDGGAGEAQELACLAATTAGYLRALDEAGLAPAEALAQMEFALATDTDLFLNVAKLRAARAVIARIAGASGAGDAAPGLALHATTSARMLARRDPYVNLLRTTVAAAGAALGGADAVTVLPFTHALGQPDGFARRMARNIQVILQEESFPGWVLDPAGGSWYVESLTRDLAQQAWTLFQEIEAEGGMAEALAKGTVQKRIAATAEQRARDVALGKNELTGVSAFPDLAGKPAEVTPRPLPDELADPAITVEPVPLCRPAEPFERLRAASDAYLKDKGHRPKVFLASLGDPADFTASATHASRFFAAGGIEAIPADGFATAEDAAAAFEKGDAAIACIAADEETLAEMGEDAAKGLKKAGAKRVYVAARPGDRRQALKKAGVDDFVHQGCDILETLETAHDILGLKAYR